MKNHRPSEWRVIQGLIAGLHLRSICIPRFTPNRWWECDVFELTKAGFFREYEVKLSLSDFRADAKKERQPIRLDQPAKNKHQMLREGSPHGPTAFSYVVPAGMIPREMLPDFAGLVEFVWNPDRVYPVTYRTVVRAPRLHRQEWNPKLVPGLFRTSYYRMIHLMLDRNFRFDHEPSAPGEGEDCQIPPSPSLGALTFGSDSTSCRVQPDQNAGQPGEA